MKQQILFLLLTFIHTLCAVRVLVYSPVCCVSHTNFMARIADSLTKAGHNVTFLTPIVDESRRFHMGVELTKHVITVEQDEEMKRDIIPVDDNMGIFWNLVPTYKNAPFGIITFQKLFPLACGNLFRNKKLIEELRTHKYDVAVTEPFHTCGFALFRHLGIENVVMTSSCVNYDILIPTTGEPEDTSYVPSMISQTNEKMTFLERLENYRVFNAMEAAFAEMFDSEMKMYRKYLGEEFPDWRELIPDASMHLINSIPYLDFPRPSIQKTVPIGGISVDMKRIESKKLSAEWDEILEKRQKNMFVSFGSLMKSSEMPLKYRENLLKVFQTTPNVTFIWKYELKDVSFAKDVDNVEFVQWAPQTSLINDKRVDAFMTHGGLGSTHEAAYIGIPTIMVPLFAEQPRNSYMLSRHGGAIYLGKTELGDFDKVKTAVQEVLYNDKYRRTAEKVAEMLKNRPTDPKELTVKSIEFVARYGPLHQMTPISIKMPWYQRKNIDVYAFLAITHTVPFLFLIAVLKFFFVLTIRKREDKKHD